MKKLFYIAAATLITTTTSVVAQEPTPPPTDTAPPAVAPQPPPPMPYAPPPSQNNEEMEELRERVDLLEHDIETLLGEQDRMREQAESDKLYWSGSYRFVVNYINFKDSSVDTTASHFVLQLGEDGQPMVDESTGQPIMDLATTTQKRNEDDWLPPVWTHRLRLAMAYDVGDSLRFFAQLSAYKYFNEIHGEPGVLDMNSNSYPRDTGLRMERVYFDWFPTDWLAFSAGRISSTDGPPAELRENRERQAGWGVQMVEAEIEAVMTTFHLADMLEGTYLRFFYSPFAIHNDYIVSDDSSLFKGTGIDPLHAWGIVIESKIPPLDENLIQLGMIHIPRFSPRNIAIKNPFGSGSISPSTPTGNDLGAYLNANALLEFKDIMGSGLDVFGAYALTMLQPEEDRMVYNVPLRDVPIHHPIDGDTGQAYDGTVRHEVGLASYEEGDNSTSFGHMVYAGLRYTIPISQRLPTRVGGEFNMGTKYHVGWSGPSDLLVDKLGVKGWAWDVYFIQQLVQDHLFIRLGYLQMHKDYQGMFVGPTVEVNQDIQNIYVLADLSW